MKIYGLRRCNKEYFVFTRHHCGKQILLVVHVNDIVIIRDDDTGINAVKAFAEVSQQKILTLRPE